MKWRYSCTTVALLLCCTKVWTQTPPKMKHRHGIAGLSTNMEMQCSIARDYALRGRDLSGYGVFWMINGSVYGSLQVTREFIVCDEVCDHSTLKIPVVQRNMDGYTFQCVTVDYNTNTHYLGEITVLNVTTAPEGYNGMGFIHDCIQLCTYTINIAVLPPV